MNISQINKLSQIYGFKPHIISVSTLIHLSHWQKPVSLKLFGWVGGHLCVLMLQYTFWLWDGHLWGLDFVLWWEARDCFTSVRRNQGAWMFLHKGLNIMCGFSFCALQSNWLTWEYWEIYYSCFYKMYCSCLIEISHVQFLVGSL